jgi:hypothetical protein
MCEQRPRVVGGDRAQHGDADRRRHLQRSVDDAAGQAGVGGGDLECDPTSESTSRPAADSARPTISGRRGPNRFTIQAMGPTDCVASSSVWGRKAMSSDLHRPRYAYAVNTQITDAGRVAYERAQQAREAAENEILSALSHDERDQLHDLLAKALGD